MPKLVGFSPGRKRLSGNHRPATMAPKTHMKVVVRVRPRGGEDPHQRNIVKTVDDVMLVFDPKEDIEPFFFQGVKQQHRDMLKKQHKAMEFVFDRVFGSSATNNDVFEGSTKGIIANLLKGFNSSVFVYGATGAGKTFTMLGSPGNPGITYLTMVELHRQMAELYHERNFELWVSYLEVYNENVRDLLSPDKPLNLRDDGNNGVKVTGLKHQMIRNADELLDLLAQGNTNRTQHPTDSNAESSRSHAVFQVYMFMTNRLTGQRKEVKLSMIDLAGSERAAATGCRGARFKEGANINRSLLALGNCINSLADGRKHVPFRDSKLTRLLKDSLGGNCHTVMIANVSAEPRSFEDTYNTLKYALRAKKIKSAVKNNIVSVELRVQEYVTIVEELKRELCSAKKQLQEAQDAATNCLQDAAGDSNALSAEQSKLVEGWQEQLAQCFQEKVKIHKEIMRLESRLKSVKYRRNLKTTTGHRLRQLHLYDDMTLERALGRIYMSLNQFQGQVEIFKQKINENWAKEQQNNQRLDSVLKEIDTAGLSKELEKDVTMHTLQLQDCESDVLFTHLRQLAVVQQSQIESQDRTIVAMARLLSMYHTILQGHDKITGPMNEDYKKISRMLEGTKVVSWGQVHETELKAEPVNESPLQIPPRLADIMDLAFSRVKAEVGSEGNNISQLDYSKEETTRWSPRFSNDYKTQTDYFNFMFNKTENSTNAKTEPDVLKHNDSIRGACHPKTAHTFVSLPAVIDAAPSQKGVKSFDPIPITSKRQTLEHNYTVRDKQLVPAVTSVSQPLTLPNNNCTVRDKQLVPAVTSVSQPLTLPNNNYTVRDKQLVPAVTSVSQPLTLPNNNYTIRDKPLEPAVTSVSQPLTLPNNNYTVRDKQFEPAVTSVSRPLTLLNNNYTVRDKQLEPAVPSVSQPLTLPNDIKDILEAINRNTCVDNSMPPPSPLARGGIWVDRHTLSRELANLNSTYCVVADETVEPIANLVEEVLPMTSATQVEIMSPSKEVTSEPNLNGTYVMSSPEENGEQLVKDAPVPKPEAVITSLKINENKKTMNPLKRSATAKVNALQSTKCNANKENKIQTSLAWNKSGPSVPKAPRIITTNDGKKLTDKMTTPLRTPLRTTFPATRVQGSAKQVVSRPAPRSTKKQFIQEVCILKNSPPKKRNA